MFRVRTFIFEKFYYKHMSGEESEKIIIESKIIFSEITNLS